MARRRTMSDVVRLFTHFTGESFFPNANTVGRSIIMRRIVDAFDQIIQAQATGLEQADNRKRQFRALTENEAELRTELVPAALGLFLELHQLLHIAKPVIVAARKAGWQFTTAKKKRLLVFATGGKDGGGSGFENLVIRSREEPIELDADVFAVVSNHHSGGVAQRSARLDVPFIYYNPDTMGEQWYGKLFWLLGADFVALSGWLKFVVGFPDGVAINIHPGNEQLFGGEGMHGDHVHEATLAAFHRGDVMASAVSMFFVTEDVYDDPHFTFYRQPVSIQVGDTVEILKTRVNGVEHRDQPKMTNMVVQGEIRWAPNGVIVPDEYRQQECCPDELRHVAATAV